MGLAGKNHTGAEAGRLSRPRCGETLTRSATTENESALVFEISNTGTWVERGSRPGIPSTGIGHDNLRERLRRHYPDAHAFTHSTMDGWVHVRLELRATSRTT
jgi:LytS/YehU family sensor histidine kinase